MPECDSCFPWVQTIRDSSIYFCFPPYPPPRKRSILLSKTGRCTGSNGIQADSTLLSANSARALASAKVPCDTVNLSQAHKDVIDGIGRQDLSSRQQRLRVSSADLVSAQGGGDVMWLDVSSNNTTFLLPKQQVSNSSPLLNTANGLSDGLIFSLVSYQTRFRWSVHVHTSVCI